MANEDLREIMRRRAEMNMALDDVGEYLGRDMLDLQEFAEEQILDSLATVAQARNGEMDAEGVRAVLVLIFIDGFLTGAMAERGAEG